MLLICITTQLHNMTRMISFGVLLAFVTASLAAVSNVEADLSTIAAQVTSLSSAIEAFPTTDGNLLSALVRSCLIYIYIRFLTF